MQAHDSLTYPGNAPLTPAVQHRLTSPAVSSLEAYLRGVKQGRGGGDRGPKARAGRRLRPSQAKVRSTCFGRWRSLV